MEGRCEQRQFPPPQTGITALQALPGRQGGFPVEEPVRFRNPVLLRLRADQRRMLNKIPSSRMPETDQLLVFSELQSVRCHIVVLRNQRPGSRIIRSIGNVDLFALFQLCRGRILQNITSSVVQGVCQRSQVPSRLMSNHTEEQSFICLYSPQLPGDPVGISQRKPVPILLSGLLRPERLQSLRFRRRLGFLRFISGLKANADIGEAPVCQLLEGDSADLLRAGGFIQFLQHLHQGASSEKLVEQAAVDFIVSRHHLRIFLRVSASFLCKTAIQTVDALRRSLPVSQRKNGDEVKIQFLPIPQHQPHCILVIYGAPVDNLQAAALRLRSQFS